jgi:hypothetical protein
VSDKPLSSSEQVSGTHAVIHAEAQVRLLSLATGGLLAPAPTRRRGTGWAVTTAMRRVATGLCVSDPAVTLRTPACATGSCCGPRTMGLAAVVPAA